MKKLGSKGFSAIEAIIIVVVLALLGGVGWYVFNKKKNDDKKKEANKTQQQKTKKEEPSKISDLDDLKLAASDYCKTSAVQFWKDGYSLTVDPASVTATVNTDGDSSADKGNYARLSMSCDSTKVSEDKKMSGFVAYFEKINNSWTFYTKDQQAPGCVKFDGKGWPVEVVPVCFSENGTSRAPK